MSWKNPKQTSLADALLIEHAALTELDGVHDLINWPTISAELAYCFAVLSAYRWISASLTTAVYGDSATCSASKDGLNVCSTN